VACQKGLYKPYQKKQQIKITIKEKCNNCHWEFDAEIIKDHEWSCVKFQIERKERPKTAHVNLKVEQGSLCYICDQRIDDILEDDHISECKW